VNEPQIIPDINLMIHMVMFDCLIMMRNIGQRILILRAASIALAKV